MSQLSDGARETIPATGAEGWFNDQAGGTLIGAQCGLCGALSFPPATGPCRDPRCRGTTDERVPLSRHGRVWAATSASYQPPPPYIATTEPFEPFTLAAVEVPEHNIVILGQVVAGIGPDELPVGTPVEVVVETLYVDGDVPRSIYRWAPSKGSRS